MNAPPSYVDRTMKNLACWAVGSMRWPILRFDSCYRRSFQLVYCYATLKRLLLFSPPLLTLAIVVGLIVWGVA